jgi:3-oxoadipate enol-lactonase
VPLISTRIGRINANVQGERARVLLLHPIGTNLQYWQDLADALARDHRVVRLDAFGHGRSDDAPANISMTDHAESIHAVLQFLDAAPAWVIGLSLGGMLAQQLAIQFPEDIAGLVLAGTSSSVSAERAETMRTRGELVRTHGMEVLVEESIERWLSPEARTSPLADRIRSDLRAFRPDNWANTWMAMSTFNALPRLSGLRVPTLVVSGGSDASTPPSVGAVTAQAIPGAVQHVVEGGAHFLPFEWPERFNPLVLDFIKQHADRTEHSS